MTFLRHSTRAVHQTLAAHTKTALTTLGWFDTPAPLGGDTVRFTTTPIKFGSRAELISASDPGLVIVSMGQEFEPDLLELGGPLAENRVPFFVDIFQSKDGYAQALAEDVRDLYLGRTPALGSRFLEVVDPATGTPVDGWRIALEDLQVDIPDVSLPLSWRVVKVTAAVQFQEVVV